MSRREPFGSIGEDVDALRSRLGALEVIDLGTAPPVLGQQHQQLGTATFMTAAQRRLFAQLRKVHQGMERSVLPAVVATEGADLEIRSVQQRLMRQMEGTDNDADSDEDSLSSGSFVALSEVLPESERRDVPPQTHEEWLKRPNSKLAPEGWTPPHHALESNPRDVSLDEVPLLTDIVVTRPVDQEAAVRLQEGCCRGCGAALQKGGPLSFVGEKPIFCHYFGFYFCSACHGGRSHEKAIPSRVVHRWEFTKFPVSRAAEQFLEFHDHTPLICLSAINPRLYQEVPILRKLRELRVQLNRLHTIGIKCDAFCSAFYQARHAPAGTRTSTSSSGTSTFIAEDARHYIEDTEFWSMADLRELRSTQIPSSSSALDTPSNPRSSSDTVASRSKPTPVKDCPLLMFLRHSRDEMVRHVSSCTELCRPAAARTCESCRRPGEPVFSFDLNRAVMCPKCSCVYHKLCWLELPNGCVSCSDRRAAK